MKKLSYQLYSSRNHPPLEDTLAMLAAAGYGEVEGYFGCYSDGAATARALQATGLRMASGHFGLDELENDTAACVALAGQLGMQTIYCPYLADDQRPADAEGWRAFGARLAQTGAALRDAGLRFGWHNHDFEVRPLADGSLPLDIILAADDKMEWEADLAWIVRGDGDVASCIERHQDRLTAVHIKDIAPAGECADEDGWADVGHGTMDWNGLLERLGGSPVRHFVVEHDKPSDDKRFAERSAESILSLPAWGS